MIDRAAGIVEWVSEMVVDAKRIAEQHLAEALPRRWRHVQGVVRQAERARGVVDDPDLLVAAAWLHDVGYAPHLARTGLHQLDGAAFLAKQPVPERICALIVHHSCARIEARNRGISIEWADEQSPLRDALWWADMTTTPGGEVTDVRQRIDEVCGRYGPGHIVTRSVTEATDELLAAASRTETRLANLAQV